MTIRKLTSIILAIVMIISISVITVSADYDAVIAENETVVISASFEEAATVKFVAAETKKLALKSDSYDIFCTVYDENYERLELLYSDGASIEYEFEAGKTYSYTVKAGFSSYRSTYIADALKIKRLSRPALSILPT